MLNLKNIKPLLLATSFVVSVPTLFAQAQNDDLKSWYLKDLKKDSFYGISLQQAYAFLGNKKHQTVVVGVIDSGIDTTHEDLKNVIYNKPSEIAGNGVDDDHNGYVDDVHGWNFLGNKNGKDLNKDVEEKYRTYYKYKKQFTEANFDASKLDAQDLYTYQTWRRADSIIHDPKKVEELEQQNVMLGNIYDQIKESDSIVKPFVTKENYTFQDLLNARISDPKASKARQTLLVMQGMLQLDDSQAVHAFMNELNSEYTQKHNAVSALNTPPANTRAEIIGDNYADFADRYYGNTDVMAGDPMHGTHVSGIIAADRTNNIGINGIANDVKIMAIRAVPDGDEYDKDVALAIRYAADNGVKVINMSFGKAFSPQKYWVDSAIAYAASKDVLIVQAAGNDGLNLDSNYNFPNPHLLFVDNTQAKNVITVGASQDPHIEPMNIVASFSNYGKGYVNVFSPGVKIFSTLPKGNQYGFLDGTSMASPVVAGIAALIRSYYPALTAVQVKDIIEKSVVVPDGSVKIALPGDDKPIKLSDICTSGGIVNAANAVRLADEISHNKEIPTKVKGKKKTKKA